MNINYYLKILFSIFYFDVIYYLVYFCDNKSNIMTNIKEKNIKNDVHSHIDMAYAKIKDRLPENYVAKVFEKLNNDTTLTSGIIRNIKNRNNTYPKSRIKVLIALVEIADEYQLELNKLKEAIK
jgi:hypothetical protein